VKQLWRLEQYTLKRREEVLLVTAKIDEDLDQIMVFKGFSSSLMRPTAFDPDIPVLPENAVIIRIDRLQSPYIPDHPRYIQQELSWQEMRSHLEEVDV
jgi:hypothetical protein